MAYQMARLPITLRLKVTFVVLNLCNTYNSGNIACFNSSCLPMNWKAHTTCNLNFIVKAEGLLKVTGSDVHWKSSDISETVLDKNSVTTGH